MVWSFPLRLKNRKPGSKPKPVNNIADLRQPMWIGLARKPQWRCLLPATGIAEAEGEKGSSGSSAPRNGSPSCVDRACLAE